MNVLSVMDSHVQCAVGGSDRSEARAARAAVAELLEADKEYDEANANLSNHTKGSLTERMKAFSAAEARRAAALAQCGVNE